MGFPTQPNNRSTKSKKSCCSSFLMFTLPTLYHQIEYTMPSLVTETVIARRLTSVSPYMG